MQERQLPRNKSYLVLAVAGPRISDLVDIYFLPENNDFLLTILPLGMATKFTSINSFSSQGRQKITLLQSEKRNINRSESKIAFR